MGKMWYKWGVAIGLIWFCNSLTHPIAEAAPKQRLKPIAHKPVQEINFQSGRQWWLVQVEHRPIQHKKGRMKPFIQFNISDSLAHGFSGCNSFSCPIYIDTSGNYRFGQITNTLLACMEEKTENAFMNGLINARKMVIMGAELYLVNENSHTLLKFRLTTAP